MKPPGRRPQTLVARGVVTPCAGAMVRYTVPATTADCEGQMAHEFGPELEEDEKRKDKRIALLISILALFLALSEMLGKSAQTEALHANVSANDLWSFYQAKVIRMTVLRTAVQTLEFDLSATTDAELKDAKRKVIDTWTKTADRYESDPDKKEGRKELEERAHEAEQERDRELVRYHHYEFASAALQIGIVLASASVITTMPVLAWLAGGLGLAGVALTAVGFFTPDALHALHIM